MMWLSDFRLVLPDRVVESGSVRIEDGLIAEVIEGAAPDSAVEGHGLTLIPGLIDLHGDMIEREVMPRPGAPFPIDLALFELDKRLAGAGITTAFASLSFSWNDDDHIRSDKMTSTIIETINTIRDRLLIDMYVHGRFEVTNALAGPSLTRLLDAGQIQLVSIMDHTVGQGQYKDVNKYVDFITKWLGIEPEDLDPQFLTDRIQTRIARQQQREWSWEVVNQIVEISTKRGIVVASHDDDTAAKVDRLAELGVTISEFPVTMEAAEHAKSHGMHVVMGAPNALRGYSHSGNISSIEAIEAGLVDVLAVDYYPAALLHAPFEIAARGVLPLHEAIKLVSANPAAAVKLADRGAITVGLRADLAIIETEPERRVRGTLRGGQPIFWDAEMAKRGTVGEPMKGEA